MAKKSSSPSRSCTNFFDCKVIELLSWLCIGGQKSLEARLHILFSFLLARPWGAPSGNEFVRSAPSHLVFMAFPKILISLRMRFPSAPLSSQRQLQGEWAAQRHGACTTCVLRGLGIMACRRGIKKRGQRIKGGWLAGSWLRRSPGIVSCNTDKVPARCCSSLSDDSPGTTTWNCCAAGDFSLSQLQEMASFSRAPLCIIIFLAWARWKWNALARPELYNARAESAHWRSDHILSIFASRTPRSLNSSRKKSLWDNGSGVFAPSDELLPLLYGKKSHSFLEKIKIWRSSNLKK